MSDEGAVLQFLARPPPGTPPAVAAALWRSIPPARRRAERDALLRRAAELLPGAPWAKAGELARLALPPRIWRESAALEEPDLSTPRGCVQAALLIAPGRRGRMSARQIYRVIAANGPATCQRDRLHD